MLLSNSNCDCFVKVYSPIIFYEIIVYTIIVYKIRDFEKLKTEFQSIKNLQRNKNKKTWNDFRITY